MSRSVRSVSLGLIATLLAGCMGGPPPRYGGSITEAPALAPTPAPIVNPAEEYLVTLTGFRYAPLEGPSAPFVNELETGSLQDIVAGKAARSIVFNGDAYQVSVYVYALRPLAAGAFGAQDDILEKIGGKAWVDDIGLGGRTVGYLEKESLSAYAWLQRTFFVVVVSREDDRAYTIAERLIDANTLESHYILTGQVTSKATGGPLSGVTVVLFKGGFAPCCELAMPSITTGSTGRFTVTVPEGNYRIMFYPYGLDGYGAAWWKDGPTFEGATDLVVTKNTGQLDTALPAGHAVRGTVTSNYGGGLAGAHVDVFSADGGWVTSSVTLEDGRYLVRLAPGQYRVYIAGPRGSELKGVWWPGTTASDRSKLLVVPSKDSQQLDIELKGEIRSN